MQTNDVSASGKKNLRIFCGLALLLQEIPNLDCERRKKRRKAKVAGVDNAYRLGHLTVLTGYRMLPRKDLVAIRYYFLLDAACAAIAYHLHQADYFFPILVLQQWQHIFYFSTWDQSGACKRVISWSSLDWDRGRWNQIDLVLGTVFDMGVHIANTYFLGVMLTPSSQITGILVTIGLYQIVIKSSSLAWASKIDIPGLAWASKTEIPDWVSKRIKPLTAEQIQEVQWFDKLKIM